jgi:rhodanese-related sulfurtransferase
VLDVRQTDEFDNSHLRGAINIPLHELADRIGELPGCPVWVHCASGYRASVAASILDRHDLGDDSNLSLYFVPDDRHPEREQGREGGILSESRQSGALQIPEKGTPAAALRTPG